MPHDPVAREMTPPPARAGRGWGLQARLVALVLLAALPALAIQLYSVVAQYNARERQVEAEASRLARFVAAEFARIVDADRALMVAMAALPELRAHDAAGCAAFARALRGDYPENVGLAGIDRDGRLFCTSLDVTPGTLAPAQGDYADTEFFRQAKASGDFTVAPFVQARLAHIPALPLALPIRDAGGAFDGIIASSIDLRWLGSYFAARLLPKDGAISIMDRNGTFLVRVPEIPGQVGAQVADSFRWLLSAPRPGVARGVGTDEKERIFAYTSPDSPPLRDVLVFVGIGRDAAMADVRWAAMRDVALLLAALALAILAAVVGGRRFVTSPLARLVHTAGRWSDGDMQARARLDGGTKEVATLGAAFDRMAATVEHRERALTLAVASRDQALEHQTLLTAELNHRVKNTLATVQSIARLSLRGAGAGVVVADFTDRLLALSRAHDVLTRESWNSADLGEIVTAALAPVASGEPGRIVVAGPPVRLLPRAALAVAMGLHELCTNAVKYGALSVPGGRVQVEWQREAAGSGLVLTWRERGGPPVLPPQQRGFGSRLLERVLGRDLGGAVELSFADPAGVLCTLRLGPEALPDRAPDPGLAAALAGVG